MGMQNDYPKLTRRWVKKPKSSKVLEFQKDVVTKTIVCRKLQETTKELEFDNFETISRFRIPLRIDINF